MALQPCSKFFAYEDFYYCSRTWQRTKVPNTPKETETLEAIQQLATTILDPIVEAFGKIHISYGFCSQALASQVKKNAKPQIAPNLDQHAGYELNSKGNRICHRDGFACDFIIEKQNMRTVAKWIINNCDFDRMYFYSDDLPLHISTGPENIRQIVTMTTIKGRRIPRVIKEKAF